MRSVTHALRVQDATQWVASWQRYGYPRGSTEPHLIQKQFIRALAKMRAKGATEQVSPSAQQGIRLPFARRAWVSQVHAEPRNKSFHATHRYDQIF